MSTAGRSLGWGILGTARINDKILPLLGPGTRSRVAAVASRDAERARAYAAQRGIPRAYGSYVELLDDPEVEVVYLSLPNHLHVDWTLEAVRRGKHVLCEKPLAMRAVDVDRIAAEARLSGAVVTEAFMYRHHRQTLLLKEIVATGQIGELRSIQGSFHFTVAPAPNIRLDPSAGGGALRDIGCYLTSLVRFLAGSEPEQVFGWANPGPTGVDLAFHGLLKFAGGVTGAIDCSFGAPRTDTLEIVGSQAILRVPHPFKPSKREEIEWLRPSGLAERSLVMDERDPYLPQTEDLVASILDGTSNRISLHESRGNAATLEALLRSADSGQPVSLPSVALHSSAEA